MKKLKCFVLVFVFILIIILFPSCKSNSNENGNINSVSESTVDEIISDDIPTIELFDETINGNGNFKKTVWGMSMEEVMDIEDLDLAYTYAYTRESTLCYKSDKTEPFSIPTMLLYTFENNKLVTVIEAMDNSSELLEIRSSNDIDYYGIYSNLIEKYTGLYGEPYISEIDWTDELDENDEVQDWNESIISGLVSFYSEWETKYTKLTIGVYCPTSEYLLRIIVHARKLDSVSPVYKEKEKVAPAIGMTKEEAENSTWGRPTKVNRTTTVYGVHEQWVYPRNRYLYFDDGILTAIQD